MSKDARINLRVTAEEMKRIEWAADFREISISDYVRNCALQHRNVDANIHLTFTETPPPMIVIQRLKTEPVHSEELTKTTKTGHDICRYCGLDIYLAKGYDNAGPYWLHADTKGSHCGTFATPRG